MRDRERKGTYIVAGRGCHGRLTNKIVLSLSSDREWHIDVVVSKYTQTKQRRLRTKMVKSSHGRYYKKKPLLCIGTTTTIVRKRIGLRT